MIFREYDIRGIYGKDLTEDVVENIGRAYCIYLKKRAGKDRLKVSIARDVRLSSKALRDAIVKGITSEGIDVVDLGITPTPLLYFSLFYLSETLHPLQSYAKDRARPLIDGGIMITGSHNPPEYNGFKVCVGKETLFGEEIQEIRRIGESIKDRSSRQAVDIGVVEEFDIITPYKEFVLQNFDAIKGKGKKLKVVIDPGNGTVGPIATELGRELGCEVIELYCKPDGRFPNHHPDPTIVDNLKDLIRTVKEKGADIGIGYDGDGDRIGVVDEEGEIVWPDRLMILYSRDIITDYLSRKDSNRPTIVFDVKCTHLLPENIERYGGRPLMWKTGHSLLKGKMKEENAVLAGEMSGHIFFGDRYFGYDDAIYASMRLFEIILKQGKGVHQLLSDIPTTHSTPEIRVDSSEDKKFKIVDEIVRFFKEIKPHQLPNGLKVKDLITIDGVRVIFDRGWALIRASNTQPVLVLRFEAEDEEALQSIKDYMEGILKRFSN